ncbi:hypothetical protein MNBD_GAMMA11-3485 [hydrothermal vent metagenome]|uniref:Methyl-accepting transducer domain-containing protein n=1 Tax=hydrothermal vent metagenome TaxID=652676 RepID=A0A3B0XFE0_9ZZZZ
MSSLNQFKIKHRLIFIIVLFLLVISSMTVVFNYTQTLSKDTWSLSERFMLIEHTVLKISKLVLQARFQDKNFLMYNNLKYVKKYKKDISELNTQLNMLISLVDDVEQISMVNNVRRSLNNYAHAFEDVVKSRVGNGLPGGSALSYGEQGGIKPLITAYVDRSLKVVKGIDDVNEKIKVLQQTTDVMLFELQLLEKRTYLLAEEEGVLFELRNTQVQSIYYIMLAVMAGLTVLLMAFIIRDINRSTMQLHGALLGVSSGNASLTESLFVEGKDEMADIASLFNQLLVRLNSMLGEMASMSCHLTCSADSAKHLKDETTRAIQTQVGEIDKIAGEINLMTTSIERVAENARSASIRANEADHNTGTGQRVVAEVIGSIEQLAHYVEQTGESVEQLNVYSREIDSVIAMINGIAEQTNLLALNAAIEAARAGESGRGFAVVADEVRTLSQRTTSFTDEIKKTIANLQQGAKQSAEAMKLGREQAIESVGKAQQAGEALSAIAESVASIATLNADMSQSASQQSKLAGEINQNIQGINIATNQLAVSARQTMSDSGDISQTASMLQSMSRQFGASEAVVELPSDKKADESSDIELF